MPNNKLTEFIRRLESMETWCKDHSKESIKIQVQLNINTILTGLVLTAIIGKILTEYFKG